MGQAFSGLGGAASDMGTGAKLLQGGTKGLLTGFSDMQKQNAMMRQSGGSAEVPMTAQPQVQLPMGNDPIRKPNPYFYGYGGGQ